MDRLRSASCAHAADRGREGHSFGCGLPACDAPGQRTLDQLLEATLKDGQPRLLSCRSVADASRWAPQLLTGLSQGLTAYASNLERDKLKQVIAESNDDRDDSQLAAELQLYGESFAEPHRRVAPGQSVVLYRSDEVLGGGIAK